MEEKGRNKISFKEILHNEERQKIYQEILKKPFSIAQLSKNLNLNRGTLKHHLIILERAKLIKRQQQKDLPGKPVLFFPFQKEDEEYTRDLIKILKKIKSSEEMSLLNLFLWAKEEGIKESYLFRMKYLPEPQLVEQHIKLTSAGKAFLKENKEKVRGEA